MNRNELNSKYRQFVRDHLSPSPAERATVSRIYDSIRAALGQGCFLIGSYARFTATRRLHDLDVLFLAGKFDPHHLRPRSVIREVRSLLDRHFINPTSYQIGITEQSHSITIAFTDGKKEMFAVDVVPAFASGNKNEFGDDVYWVPEIALVPRQKRQARYEVLAKRNRNELEWWLKSDPRGYITATAQLNSSNPDFRRASKFIKSWKYACGTNHETFELKSFHIEQALFRIYMRRPGIDVTDSIFEFFCSIPEIIAKPQIRDRADQARFIDQYLVDLTPSQKQTIIQARDFLLINLEYLGDRSAISDLLRGGLHTRASPQEQYLFDSRIPVLLEPGKLLGICANVLPRPGFRPSVLDWTGIINVGRRIAFSANVGTLLDYDSLKWKVKNDDSSPEPRGEITDHRTRNDPEATQYRGAHFVECYAVKNNVCVARARQNVVLKSI